LVIHDDDDDDEPSTPIMNTIELKCKDRWRWWSSSHLHDDDDDDNLSLPFNLMVFSKPWVWEIGHSWWWVWWSTIHPYYEHHWIKGQG
jgi:hypothetical protein